MVWVLMVMMMAVVMPFIEGDDGVVEANLEGVSRWPSLHLPFVIERPAVDGDWVIWPMVDPPVKRVGKKWRAGE